MAYGPVTTAAVRSTPVALKRPAFRTNATLKPRPDSVKQATPAELGRRSLGLLAGAAYLLSSSHAPPAQAAFGEAARIFAPPAPSLGMMEYHDKDNRFSFSVPSRWYINRERPSRDHVVRFQDNAYNFNNVEVIATNAPGKSSIHDFGGPEEFLMAVLSQGLLGENVWKGETISEGGFAKNQVSKAALLSAEEKVQNGRPYYAYNIITGTADNTEGGRHHRIVAAVGSDGMLYLCKAQTAEKRIVQSGPEIAKIARTFQVA